MAIKKLDPKAVFKIISRQDDAVEHEELEELKTGTLDANGDEVLKESRYDQYLASDYDEKLLKLKEGASPDRFVVRGLTADESAELTGRYLSYDPVTKRASTGNNFKMFLDTFRMTYQGIETDGKLVKTPVEEIPYSVQVEIGSVANLITTLGKNLKKS